MTAPNDTDLASRPAVDEWGMYDPQQAGLAALYSRLQTLKRIGNTPIDRQMLRRVAHTPVDRQLITTSVREVRRFVNGEI